jgi:ankyrin repeat protein
MKACDFQRPRNKGHERSVYWLLTLGADANTPTPEGATPLLLCVAPPLLGNSPVRSQLRAKVARLLLRHGADPNALSPAGTTALMFAARDDDVVLARALLTAGARPEVRAPDGRTALDVAKAQGSQGVVEVLS